MFWNKNRTDKEKPKVKLEGCLDASQDNKGVLCGHGNYADSCYLCEKNKQKSSLDSMFDSNSFGRTVNLDD